MPTERQIENRRAYYAQRAALRAVGLTDGVISRLRYMADSTGDERWVDPAWLAQRTESDLMVIPGMNTVGRARILDALGHWTLCPHCDGTGRIPRMLE